jgi:hypothetical protein
MTRQFGYESSANGKHLLLMDFWLVIARDPRGGRPGARVTAGYPSLNRNERAINLKMELPVALFEAPVLKASIMVDTPDQPITIDTSAIAEAVQTAIGMDVHIEVKDPAE